MNVTKTQTVETYIVDTKYWVDVDEDYKTNRVRITVMRRDPIDMIAAFDSWDEAIKNSELAREVHNKFYI